MAKLFYTLEEAAQRLKMDDAEVKQLVASGQLQEFRDRDRLMFKVDQVELLAHKDDEPSSGIIPLAESGELGSINLASDSGSGMNLESPKEQTGISIFDSDQTEEADPSAVTQITEGSQPEISLETVGSGSGLLDLTREADDTSLGRDLLEGVAGESDTAAETVGAGDSVLFESSSAEVEVAAAPTGLAMLAEPYDGPGSGFAGGLALGIVAILALTLTLTLFGLASPAAGGLIQNIGANFWPWVGGLAAGLVVCAIIGWVIGRRG